MPDVFWESKQRDHATPVSTPQLADGGIEPIPLLGTQVEIQLRFGLGSSSIDQFQVSGDFFAVFVGHLFERVTHHMYHAEVDAGVR
jgi:hypothetical protein